jgi:phage tail sheath gpL-like
VTLTAKTSGADPTAGEFNISATAATQAASMVTAINTVSTLSGIVTASNVLGVITLTAVAPGTIGNGLQLSEALTNVAITHAFGATVPGVDGHTFDFNVGQA